MACSVGRLHGYFKRLTALGLTISSVWDCFFVTVLFFSLCAIFLLPPGVLPSAGPSRAVLFLAAPRQPLLASPPDRQPAGPQGPAEGDALREFFCVPRRF